MLPKDPEERLKMFRIMARQAAGAVELNLEAASLMTPEAREAMIEANARRAAAKSNEEYAALGKQAREEVERVQRLGRPLTEAEESELTHGLVD